MTCQEKLELLQKKKILVLTSTQTSSMHQKLTEYEKYAKQVLTNSPVELKVLC
jgi:hypothetical protein